MRAFVPGIYPRSDALIQATRDLDRGRVKRDAVDRQFEADLEQFVSAQQQAGLDLLADGMLRWQDLFRPLLEASRGLEPGPLTRFLDTNTFYRAPSAGPGTLELAAPLDERYVAPLPGPRLVTLPSPFALARGTGLSAEAVAEGVLRPQIEALEAELVDLVVLSEPFLARDGDADLDVLSHALDLLHGGPPIVLQLSFGDAGALLQRGLGDLAVEGVGVDFYATDAAAIPDGFRKLLLAGVIDARSSALEEPGAVTAFVARLAERIVGEVALVPNGDLQHVPEPVAREKVARLGQVRSTLTETAWASGS